MTQIFDSYATFGWEKKVGIDFTPCKRQIVVDNDGIDVDVIIKDRKQDSSES